MNVKLLEFLEEQNLFLIYLDLHDPKNILYNKKKLEYNIDSLYHETIHGIPHILIFYKEKFNTYFKNMKSILASEQLKNDIHSIHVQNLSFRKEFD